jgi:AraC-like DNA-binding protein
MRLAAMWLSNGTMSVAEAAARLGYASDAAFNRAFKRFMSAPPASVRTRAERRQAGAA